MEANRVVQIRAAGELSSGYVIAPGLVLACAHGLKNADRNDTVSVRGINDLKKPAQDPIFAGTILWKGEGVDAALVKILDGHPVSRRCGGARVPFACLTSQRLCKGTGFPSAVITDESEDNKYEFSGEVQEAGGSDSLLVELKTKLPDADDWAGISGAALLCGRALVGIMRQTHKALGSGGLRAEPIEKLFQDEGFLECVKGFKLELPVPYIATFDVHRVRTFVCNIDRQKPAQTVKAHFGTERWPKIVVVPGVSRQKHERFIERLARFEMKALLDDVDVEPDLVFPELSWPKSLRIDSSDKYRSWLGEAWPRLGGFAMPDGLNDIAACADALKTAIEHSPGPHGFWVSVNQATAQAGVGHGAFLAKWGALWKAIREIEGPDGRKGLDRPFGIFLCLVDGEPPAPDEQAVKGRFPWSRQTAPPPPADAQPTWDGALGDLFKEGALYGAEELQLEDIPYDEVRGWISRLREFLQHELNAPAIYCEDIDEMAEHLKAKHAGRDWSMVDFDDHTNTFFNGRRP